MRERLCNDVISFWSSHFEECSSNVTLKNWTSYLVTSWDISYFECGWFKPVWRRFFDFSIAICSSYSKKAESKNLRFWVFGNP
jgi:hypothetical protein